MDPMCEEVVIQAVTEAYRELIEFSVREAGEEVCVDFQTPHPGFFWINPDHPHAYMPPAFIVDANSGEVQDGFCVKKVIAFQDPDSLPWVGVEDDGERVQAETYTLVCDARLLCSVEGAAELQRFLQASLGEFAHIALSNFQFRS